MNHKAKLKLHFLVIPRLSHVDICVMVLLERVLNMVGVDFFGERPPLRIMQEIEEQVKYFIDTNMYILSDVWLDNRKVVPIPSSHYFPLFLIPR